MNRSGGFSTISLLVILLVVLAAGYFGLHSMIVTKRNNEQVTQTISESVATSTDQVVSNTGYKLSLPTATTTTPSDWKYYTNKKLGYSISYPTNLILSASSQDQDKVTFSFPTERYFHWPLQDDVVVSITASSSCPDMIVPVGPFTATTTFSLNGLSFDVTKGDDAAAGNRYQEIAYDTYVNNICYRIDLYDHGTNGAGFYVDGQALIQKYDNQHEVDLTAVISVLNSITNSFRLQPVDVLQ